MSPFPSPWPSGSLLRSAVPLLVGLGWLATACGGNGDDEVKVDFQATPYGVSACDTNDGRLTMRRELRVFYNGPVDVADATRGLQRYYQRHGITFFSTKPAAPVAQAYALDTELTSLGRKLQAMFPGVDLDDADALKAQDPALYMRVVTATANLLFGPMVEFARAHGTAGQGVTNFVVVEHLLRPDGDPITLQPGATLAGLAISPALLKVFANQSVDEGAIWKGVELPEGFTPMMFLDATTISRAAGRDPVLRDLVVAHEFGHTGGLVHRQTAGNLMNPGVAAGVNHCTDTLEPDQIATMRTTFGLEPTRQALTTTSDRSTAPPSPRAAFDLLPPQQLRALLHGSRDALVGFVLRLTHGEPHGAVR